MNARYVANRLLAGAFVIEALGYRPPASAQALMADFYLASWLIGTSLGQLRQLPRASANLFFHDAEASFEAANVAATALFPQLKRQLIDAVYFAICAEIRHLPDRTNKFDHVFNNKTDARLMTEYFRSYAFYSAPVSHMIARRNDKIADVFQADHRGYQDSYKAAERAIRKTGQSRVQFVSAAKTAFQRADWSSSYGGKAWADIAEAWLALASTDDSNLNRLAVQIDHIYDLQHNTGTVFTKLKSYYSGGYDWIKEALDAKANVKSPVELLAGASSDLQRIARRIFKAIGVPVVVKSKSQKIRPSDVAADTSPFLVLKGTWKGGTWKGGTWKDGEWLNGIWNDGVWKKGTWKTGTWEKGIWNGGTWETGIWKNGTWKDGVWQYGIWEDGTWQSGQIWNAATNSYVKSNVSPAEFNSVGQ